MRTQIYFISLYTILSCAMFSSYAQENNDQLTIDNLQGLYESVKNDVYYIRFQGNNLTYYLSEVNGEVTTYEYLCGFTDNREIDSINTSSLKKTGLYLVVITDYLPDKSMYSMSSDCNVYRISGNGGGTIELEGQNLSVFTFIKDFPKVLKQD